MLPVKRAGHRRTSKLGKALWISRSVSYHVNLVSDRCTNRQQAKCIAILPNQPSSFLWPKYGPRTGYRCLYSSCSPVKTTSRQFPCQWGYQYRMPQRNFAKSPKDPSSVSWLFGTPSSMSRVREALMCARCWSWGHGSRGLPLAPVHSDDSEAVAC